MAAGLIRWQNSPVAGVVRVFVSYAREDRRHLEQFLTHTKGLEREGVEFFHDNRINWGERWEPELLGKIDTANIFVLLATARSVASAYCMQEFERALASQKAGHCAILPVNVAPCDIAWEHPLKAIQWQPFGKAITQRKNRDAGWGEVASALSERIERLQGRPGRAPGFPPWARSQAGPAPDGPADA